MLTNLQSDFARYSRKKGTFVRYLRKAISNADFRAVMIYRAGRWFYLKRLNFFAGCCERLSYHFCHCLIRVQADIGQGLLITHSLGIVIGSNTRIGRNCNITSGVVFGGNYNKKSEDNRTKPWIGDNVSISTGAKILGPVKIGSNSIIGANSVVTRDVPENVIVFGVPAKIIKERWASTSMREFN